jgi:hypothetical protein
MEASFLSLISLSGLQNSSGIRRKEVELFARQGYGHEADTTSSIHRPAIFQNIIQIRDSAQFGAFPPEYNYGIHRALWQGQQLWGMKL